MKNSEYGFINKGRKDDPARARGITEYAYSGGSSREGRISDTESHEEASKKWFYWLRNRGAGTNAVMRVYAGYNSVTIDIHGWDGYNKRLGICPAMHISLSEAEEHSGATPARSALTARRDRRKWNLTYRMTAAESFVYSNDPGVPLFSLGRHEA